MGGNVPLGYRAEGRTLVVNDVEAATVRTIFELYHEAGSVRALKHELDRREIVTKQRVSIQGRVSGGRPFAVGNLYEMLANPVYIGQIRHKGTCHPGLHEPIIGQALWNKTQARLQRNRQGTKEHRANAGSAPLLDKLFDETGERLVPTHAQKQGRRYRYYASHFLIVRGPDETCKGWRVPAAALEKAVASAILSLLRDRTALATAWQNAELTLCIRLSLPLSVFAQECASRRSTTALRLFTRKVQTETTRFKLQRNNYFPASPVNRLGSGLID